MCSECHQLFNTLEEVLIHQQIHTGVEFEGMVDLAGHNEESQYQCLECGSILSNSDELLLHQEMHTRDTGLNDEQGAYLLIKSHTAF